jgi:hypothetical protein
MEKRKKKDPPNFEENENKSNLTTPTNLPQQSSPSYKFRY